MKKYLVMLMLVASTLSMVAVDADAKRLGGGGSFGRQSQGAARPAPSGAPMQQQAAPRPATPPAAAPATRPASPWRGMLGGALLGLGLGSLLSHFGIGGAFASMISTLLMIALVVFAIMFVMRLFRRRETKSSGVSPAYAGGAYARSTTPEIGSGVRPYSDTLAPAAGAGAGMAAAAYPAASGAPYGVPADFDVPAFLGELDQQHGERGDHQQVERRHQPAAGEQHGLEPVLDPVKHRRFRPVELDRRCPVGDDTRMFHAKTPRVGEWVNRRWLTRC